ncbi:MAG: hypothetical protein ACK5LT_12300, partial [Lachnospirales bacterium]
MKVLYYFKKGKIINKINNFLLVMLLILGICGLTKTVVYAENDGLGTDSFSGLVIDEDVLNDPSDMDVVVRNLDESKYTVYRVPY